MAELTVFPSNRPHGATTQTGEYPANSTFLTGSGHSQQYSTVSWLDHLPLQPLNNNHSGHAGSLVSHLASEQLPQEIEKGMRDLLQRKRGNDVYDFIPQVVQDAIETFEDGRRSELFEKMQQEFPGGEQELEMLSDEEIRTRLPDAVLVDSMAGSTAVIALVDPNMKHLWVANLGDSFASRCFSRLLSIRCTEFYNHSVSERQQAGQPHWPDFIGGSQYNQPKRSRSHQGRTPRLRE
jgi:hypothetical protein